MAENTGMKALNKEENVALQEKYLTFYVDGQLYAVPSSQVIEIISMQSITYMPKLPDYVRGVINIRGKIVPLIDLCMRFGKPLPEYNDSTCIIMSEIGDASVGFIVDRVNDVLDITKDQISPPPSLSHETEDKFMAGVCKLEAGIAILLNGERILEDENLSAVAAVPAYEE